MTFDEFAPPFLLLEMHFEAKERPADEEDLLQQSWFRIFENVSVGAWQGAVERWIATQKWMPKPVEMRELCFAVAAEQVTERNNQERLDWDEAFYRRTALPADSAGRRAELQERLRRLRDAKSLRGPAASPALPDDADGR